jgi:hypothetical protein
MRSCSVSCADEVVDIRRDSDSARAATTVRHVSWTTRGGRDGKRRPLPIGVGVSRSSITHSSTRDEKMAPARRKTPGRSHNSTCAA